MMSRERATVAPYGTSASPTRPSRGRTVPRPGKRLASARPPSHVYPHGCCVFSLLRHEPARRLQTGTPSARPPSPMPTLARQRRLMFDSIEPLSARAARPPRSRHHPLHRPGDAGQVPPGSSSTRARSSRAAACSSDAGCRAPLHLRRARGADRQHVDRARAPPARPRPPHRRGDPRMGTGQRRYPLHPARRPTAAHSTSCTASANE